MSPLSSRPRLRQSLPHIHSQPDFRARFRHYSPGCRFGRTPSQFRPLRWKSVPPCACPFVAAALFSPSCVFLLPIPSPPVHRANLAPRPHRHAPTPAKLPAPSLVPLPLPTPLAHSTQTADTQLPSLHLLLIPTPAGIISSILYGYRDNLPCSATTRPSDSISRARHRQAST